MNIHNLDCIFKPKRIALIGVTENPKAVGGLVLSNLIGSGFRGVVYPVNPDLEAALGIPCYPSVKDLPKKPDLGVICAPAAKVPGLVRECGEAGILGIIIISAGFKETGPEGLALENQIKTEAERFNGMRIIGPNCLGIIVPSQNLNITFGSGMPRPGKSAFISQSGALCTSVLDWAAEEKIGFSYFVSVGNMLDVGFSDLIDYFGEDEITDSIILYIESLKHARRFMTAARAFARTKPIVAYKAGRFPESAKAAASHTGALASEDAIYEAAFERAGIARVYEIGDIFNCAELVGRQKAVAGPKLCIVTNAGGPGVMATDALMARRGVLASLSVQTMEKLDESLPPCWSHGNPVDVLGDAKSKRYAKAVELVLQDPGVDAVLAILTPQAMTNPSATAKAVAELATNRTINPGAKPILAAWLGGQSMREGIAIFNAAGVPTFSTPEEGVKAFMTLVAYARNLEILYETPRDIPVEFTLDRSELRKKFNFLVPSSGNILSEDSSKLLIEAYGIPTTRPKFARTVDDAIKVANEIGYPVVMKIHSPDITHKTDVGGVELNLLDEVAIKLAFDRMWSSVQKHAPKAKLEGVTIQPMAKIDSGVEVIIGAKRDPIFGMVILVGLGGISAELFGDRALGFPPLSERLARRMLESLKVWPLLQGYRGRPGVNIDKLIETLIRFSYLVADYPEISEIDVNPLLVGPDSLLALDARIVVDRERLGELPGRSYEHLALRPYPEEYVRSVKLRDGKDLLLRPIKPEDEPLWKDFLSSCSPESVYARFRYLFQWSSHKVATQYCFIDYGREIAIVAEQNTDKGRKLVGVGRLIAAPDLDSVEYAILINDSFQNRGLGGVLTDYCIQIVKEWGIKKIVAYTTSDNDRMLALFKERGFEIAAAEDGLMNVSLLLK